MAVTVESVRMRTPKCIEVVVLDSPIERQSPKLVELAEPTTTAYSTVTTEYNSLPGFVRGRGKTHIELLDARSDGYLNRDDALDLANYTITGVTVSDITSRHTDIRYPGAYRVTGNTTTSALQIAHEIRLHLSEALTASTAISITPPNSAFPTVEWTFTPLDTLCPSIHVNTLGHGPHDAAKLAYLSFWNNDHGTEGVEDFITDHSITEFHIIDESDAIVFTGDVTLRHDETDTEGGGGSYGGLEDTGTNLGRLISTTGGVAITAITKASPAVVTAAGHGRSNGDIVHILYAEGMNEVNFYTTSNRFTVAGVSGDTFQLSGIDSSAYTTYTGGGYVYPENQTNGAGTKVFDLDYSGFEAPTLNKNYKIYIENLGVSLPFKIDEACYYLAAKNSIGGLYNTRNGIAKDGRFGYTAPLSLVDGIPSGFHFYDSMTPLGFTANRGGPLGEADGSLPAWKVDNIRTDVKGGYQDAGDWDTRIQHVTLISKMLELQDVIPQANFEAKFGTPNLVADYGDFWAGTDDLPDIVKEAAAHFDMWRRLRLATGEVSGGYEFSLGASDLKHITQSDGTVYFPDEEATYSFAGIAAHLGRIVGEYGLTTLRDTLIGLAEESYTRAAAIVADQDTYYADVFTIADAEDIWTVSFTKAIYKSTMVTRATNARNFAVAHLYRATLDEGYRTIVESVGNPFGTTADAAFHYIKATDPNKNGTTVTSWTNSFIGRPPLFQPDSAGYAYELIKSPSVGANFGTASDPNSGNLYPITRAFGLDPDTDYIKHLYRFANFLLGANPQNMSMIRGIGANQVTGILNVDTIRSGEEAPNGVPNFGPMIWTAWAPDWLYGRGSTYNWSQLPQYRNQMADDAFDAKYRMIEPTPAQTPLWEHSVKHPSVVPMQEFAPSQIVGAFILFMVLWGHSNTPSTALGSKKRLKLNMGSA